MQVSGRSGAGGEETNSVGAVRPIGQDGVFGLGEANEDESGGSGSDGGMRYHEKETGGCGIDWLVEVRSIAKWYAGESSVRIFHSRYSVIV